QACQLGTADLHAQVAAGNHDGVAGLDDAVEIHECFATLDLRDQVAVPAFAAQQLARLVEVTFVAREGHGEIVDAELGGEPDVGAVLVGQSTCRKPAALFVDAFVVRQLTAAHDTRVDARAADAGDVEHDLAVVQQQRVTATHVPGQALVGD